MSCNSLYSLGHAALSQIDPAAHNFKVLLRHVVSRVMDAIPSKLLDQELGIKSAPGQNEEVGPESQPAEAMQGDQAQQAEHAQDAESTERQQAADPQHAKHDGGNDGDFEEEEEGRVRLPLFTNKVMTLVQDLLQYKVQICLQVQLTLKSSTASATLSVLPKRCWSADCHQCLITPFPSCNSCTCPGQLLLSHCLACAHRMTSQLPSWLPTAQWRRQPSAIGQPFCL